MSRRRQLCDVCQRCSGAVQHGIAPVVAAETTATHRVTIGVMAGSWYVCESHMRALVEVYAKDGIGDMVMLVDEWKADEQIAGRRLARITARQP